MDRQVNHGGKIKPAFGYVIEYARDRQDLMSFAISETVKGQDASGTPIMQLRAN